MAKTPLLPASVVDELIFCTQQAYDKRLMYAWIMTLEGEVHTEVLLKALDDTLTYYPKCKCVLTNNYPSWKRWFRYRWEYQDINVSDLLQEIEYQDSLFTTQDAIHYFMHNYERLSIDPSRQVPFRLVLIRHSTQVFLIFVFNHVVGDGIGSFFFIQRLIQCYEDIFYQRKKPAYAAPHVSAIELPDITFQWRNFAPRHLYPYFKYNNLLRQEPAVQLYSFKETVPSGKHLTVMRQVSPHQLQLIRKVTKAHHTTINDYLLAAMFQTIKTWNQNKYAESERVHIAVPVNLRPAEDCTLGNIISSVTLSLRYASITTREKLLPSIRQEIASLMHHSIASTTFDLACILKPIPLALKQLMLKRLCVDFAPTLMLSNLGVLSPNSSHKDEEGFHYMGSSRIVALHSLPGAGLFPGIVVATYNDQMGIALAVFSSFFPQDTAENFMDCFINEILQ